MRSADCPKPAHPLVRAAGGLCVAALTGLRLLPPGAGRILGPLLPLYPALRPVHARRLRACFAASPFSGSLVLDGYYRTRLRLLLEGLRQHGKPLSASALPGGKLRIEGLEIYSRAAEESRPLALLGLHAGLCELLHRVPPAPHGKPFYVLTAPAFSPALTAFMAAGRETGGKKILWIGSQGDRGLERGLRDAASNNGILALMADQHPGPREEAAHLLLWDRIAVPYPLRLLRFLGERGFAVVPISSHMDGKGESVLRFHSAWEDGWDIGSAGPETAIRGRVRAFLEEAITAAPDQWNWSYPKIRAVERGGR